MGNLVYKTEQVHSQKGFQSVHITPPHIDSVRDPHDENKEVKTISPATICIDRMGRQNLDREDYEAIRLMVEKYALRSGKAIGDVKIDSLAEMEAAIKPTTK